MKIDINKIEPKKIYLAIAAISALLFIPFLGSTHLFDWDEINFAECAREMVVTGNYLRVHIDFQPFWEKPPLFFWLQAASMNIFGITEFAARLPNALIGIVTLLLLFKIGKNLYNNLFGLIWTAMYAGSILPYFYFRSGIIDPLFNLFMFLSVNSAYEYFIHRRKLHQYLIGIIIGLAMLVKGPVGMLLPMATFSIYYLIKRKEVQIAIMDFVIIAVTALLTASLWFGLELIQNGTWFITTFVKYQIRLLTTGDASHGGPIYYHLLILLLGCFPASIYLFKSFKKQTDDNLAQQNFKLLMIILMFVVIVIFSLVKTKIIHYSSLAYFPLTFLAAYSVYYLYREKINWQIKTYLGFGFVGGLMSLLVIALPLIGIYKYDLMPYIQDDFVKANLQAAVVWSGYEPLIGVAMLLSVILSVYFMIRKERLKSFFISVTGVIVTFSLLLPFVTPKLEGYIQGAPVQFYKSLQKKDCYVRVLSFKSYADLYYTMKPQELSAASRGITVDSVWQKWLLQGKIDKTVYFVTKADDVAGWIKDNPEVELIEKKNGFGFMKREPKN